MDNMCPDIATIRAAHERDDNEWMRKHNEFHAHRSILLDHITVLEQILFDYQQRERQWNESELMKSNLMWFEEAKKAYAEVARLKMKAAFGLLLSAQADRLAQEELETAIGERSAFEKLHAKSAEEARHLREALESLTPILSELVLSAEHAHDYNWPKISKRVGDALAAAPAVEEEGYEKLVVLFDGWGIADPDKAAEIVLDLLRPAPEKET